ncbi:hypothetical protein [Saccharospirillum sp.]|uniref:hypothetical protein n=1 Tax=Saccharospirillum sp. TaxID=2033801 RepID=UPI00349FED5F
MVIVRHSLMAVAVVLASPLFAFDQYLLKSYEQFDETVYGVVQGGSIYSCPDRSERCFLRELNESVTPDRSEFFQKVSSGFLQPRYSTEIDGVRLDPDDELILLDYLREGRSRVLFQGEYYRWKVPRDFDKCTGDDTDPRYCWAELVRPASEERWMYVEQGYYGAYWVPIEYVERLE